MKWRKATAFGSNFSLAKSPYSTGRRDWSRKTPTPAPTPPTRSSWMARLSFAPGVSDEMRHILLEAETSGGLLFAVPEAEASEALSELHERDCPESAVVGRVAASSKAEIHVFS